MENHVILFEYLKFNNFFNEFQTQAIFSHILKTIKFNNLINICSVIFNSYTEIGLIKKAINE